MTRLSKGLLRHAIRLAVLAGMLSWPAVAPGQGLERQLDKLLSDLHATKAFNGAVLVSKDGRPVLAAGYGLADVEHAVPITPQTKFRVGSITKPFTALGIVLLQEQGALRFEDALGDHLSDVPPAWSLLTIHQVLTHTSGLMHSWRLPAFGDEMMMPASLDETLKRFHEQPLLFEPGMQFAYSGLGYFVLAKVIEVASGKSYEAFLHDEIFEPLGMHDTGADQPDIVLPHRARGYVQADGTLTNAPFIHMPIMTGGGNLYSTADDLAKWALALADRRLISAASYERLYRPEREGYAYGWGVRTRNGHTELAHGGGVPGFRAFILRVPDAQLFVVILSNVEPFQAAPLAERLVDIVLQDR